MWAAHRDGAVVTLELSAPPRNMMTFAGMAELKGHLAAIAEDDSVHVVVLASAVEGYFVGHGALEDLLAVGRGEAPSGPIDSWGSTMSLMERMPQPVIAAVDGQAWGGGCELTLACTIRIASTRAHFAQPEIDLGIIPGAGGTVRLATLVGLGRATELILTGRPIDAHEAERIGLVQVVLPPEGFRESVALWAERLARKPPAALRAAKASVRFAARNSASDALREEARLFLPLEASADAQRIQEAVLERYGATPQDRVIRLDTLPSTTT